MDDLSPAAPRRRILTTVEFDVVWERLGFGPTPIALRLDSPGRTHHERAGIVAAGLDGLRRRGLADVEGPEPELARLLTLLARPTAQVELRGWFGRSVRAVAAARNDVAVLAVRQDTAVHLQACGSLPAGVLSVLPPSATGPGRASTVPTDALNAALSARAVRPVLLANGVTPSEAGLLTRMLHGVRSRAQLVALATDRWGVVRRLPDVVTVLDTERGRYLLTRSTADDGTDWTTVAPTDDRRLHHRVAQLLSSATDAAEAAA